MDSSGSQDDGNKGGRRTGKRPGPMKFMFIDSTSHGTNAKPDKAVRSFVMHQARRQKPWSTRQKLMQSPSTEDAPRAGNRIQGSNQKQDDVDYDEIFPLESPWSEVIPSPSASKPQPLGSPVASISGSSNSSGSDSLQCTTPPSSHGSIYDATVHPKTPHRRQAHTALARQDGLALGVLDPFDCLVVRTDSKTSTLIDHFVSNMSTNLLPIDLHKLATKATTQWVAKSMRDATSAPFAYAMLTGTALHLRGLGVANIENPLYYKAQAISEINKLLSDPRTSIEDNNITAVFMLLCIEESQIVPGNKQHDGTDWSEMQRAIHLNGLRTMIQQRGGLASLGSNKCLQVFLLMHSMAHCIAAFQQPYANLLDSSGAPQKYDLPSPRSRPSSNRLLRLFRDLRLDRELYDIIFNIAVFTGDLGHWFEDRKCPFDPLELQKHACLLMYALFNWYAEGGKERTPLDQSVCLGLLIFVVKASHPYDPSYRAIILTTVKKLRAALTTTSIFRWAKSPDLLLWTLTMGAVAAQGSSEVAFFSQYCSVAFADAGCDETTAEELLERMKKCLWIPNVFDEEVKRLWTQMGLVKGEEEDQNEMPNGQEGGLISPEINEDDIVGMLTSARFFPNKK